MARVAATGIACGPLNDGELPGLNLKGSALGWGLREGGTDTQWKRSEARLTSYIRASMPHPENSWARARAVVPLGTCSR